MEQFLIAFVALTIASITDMRTREVPDWLSYALIVTGLAYHVLRAILEQSLLLLIPGMVGFGVFLAIAYLMFYTGQWGGGDSKLLMGLGGLFGLPLTSRFPFIQFTDTLVAFFLNLLLVGVVYAMVWAVALALVHREQFAKEVRNEFHQRKNWRRAMLITTLVLLMFVFILSDPLSRIALAVLVLLAPLLLYLSIFTRAVEKSAMLRRVPPSVLTEGDWVAEDVIINGKRIAGPKDLGVTKKQIKQLEQLHREKKISTVLLKVGMPFVPSFLIALIVTHFLGNLYLYLIPF